MIFLLILVLYLFTQTHHHNHSFPTPFIVEIYPPPPSLLEWLFQCKFISRLSHPLTRYTCRLFSLLSFTESVSVRHPHTFVLLPVTPTLSYSFSISSSFVLLFPVSPLSNLPEYRRPSWDRSVTTILWRCFLWVSGIAEVLVSCKPGHLCPLYFVINLSSYTLKNNTSNLYTFFIFIYIYSFCKKINKQKEMIH